MYTCTLFCTPHRTSGDKEDTNKRKPRTAKRTTQLRDLDDQDDEGEWEEVTGKGGAPMVVVNKHFCHIVYCD